jgi:hypothetical protein
MWNLLLGPILSGVKDYVGAKMSIKKAQALGEVEVLQRAAQNISDWERIHAKGSQTSWKDEFWTIIWSIPLILGFIGFEEEVAEGFTALSNMPEWYQYTLVTMVLASFGIRVNDIIRKKMGK